MAKASPKVLAEIYRLHHIPLPPITLQTLVQRGPRTTPEVIAKLQGDAAALERWKEQNATVIVQSAQLLHREVPIRLARRIVDLENLPDGLPEAPSIVKLREGLISSFDQMISFPKPMDLAGERAYMDLQARIRAEHATMQTNLADALQELESEPPGLADILDSFYNSRIGIRMLTDQHMAAQNPVPGFAGLIADHSSPVEIAHDVLAKVTPVWAETLQGRTLPEFRVSGEARATYRYIPQHISLILAEAIKNAVRGVVMSGSLFFIC
jgi:pyruvate dehydrogenase kinase 2/3/4